MISILLGTNAQTIDTSNLKDVILNGVGDVLLLSQENILYNPAKTNQSYAIQLGSGECQVNASNVLSYTIFCAQQASVTFLDRQLTAYATIDFMHTGLECLALVARNDREFWIYDEVDGHLKLINSNGDVLLLGARLKERPKQNERIILKKFGTYLYLLIEGQGIHVFDMSGNLWQTITPPLGFSDTLIKDFDVADNQLVILLPTDVLVYDLKQGYFTSIVVEDITTLCAIDKSGDKLYYIHKDGLKVQVID